MKFSLLILLSIFIFGCDSSSKSSDDFDPDRIVIVDTSKIVASTVFIDSLYTSGSGGVVGQYNDPYLGLINAKTFFKVGLGVGFEPSRDFEDNIIPIEYDSLVFIGYYADQKFYGDTLIKQTLRIHQLKEELEFEDDAYGFFSNHLFEYANEPLGEIRFLAKPLRYRYSDYSGEDYDERGDLRIPLSNKFGENLVEMAMKQNDTLLDRVKWSRFFEGIALVGSKEDDAAIIKISDVDAKTKIRLYYHDTEGESPHEGRFHDFPIEKSNFNFTNYSADRSKTFLTGLTNQSNDIKSTETDDLTFIQCGTGLATKIEIPYWDQIILREDVGNLLKVELELYPLNLSYREYAMPHLLNIYTIDEDNELINQLVGEKQKPIESLFYYDDDIFINSHFKIDLTSYLKPKLEDFESENIQLLIMPNVSSMGSFVERIVFTNEKKSDYRFKLKATFKKK